MVKDKTVSRKYFKNKKFKITFKMIPLGLYAKEQNDFRIIKFYEKRQPDKKYKLINHAVAYTRQNSVGN